MRSAHAQGKLVAKVRDTVQPAPKPEPGLSVNELLLRDVTQELPRFSDAERHCQMCALRIVRKFFGALPVTEFGPLRLRWKCC